jgi:acyl-homoserine lactone acylase PvdQ
MLVRELLVGLMQDDLHRDTDLVARTLGLDPITNSVDEFLVAVAARAADQAAMCAQTGDLPASLRYDEPAPPSVFARRAALAGLTGGDGTHLAWLSAEAVDGWCDSVLSGPVETCADAVRAAFVRALAELRLRLGGTDPAQWQWGVLHKAMLAHPLGGVPVLGALLSRNAVGAGDGHSLNAQSVEVHAPDLRRLNSHHGPGLRMVVDMGVLRNHTRGGAAGPVAHLSIDTGASGNPLSLAYANMVGLFRPERGGPAGTWPMWFGGDETSIAVGARLTLVPADTTRAAAAAAATSLASEEL